MHEIQELFQNNIMLQIYIVCSIISYLIIRFGTNWDDSEQEQNEFFSLKLSVILLGPLALISILSILIITGIMRLVLSLNINFTKINKYL